MRVVLLAAVLCAGCYLPCPQPVAPPSAPPAPTPMVVVDPPRLCVLRDGQLAEVVVEYRLATSDSVYQGVPVEQAFPLSDGYAQPHEWFRRSEPVEVRGRRYDRIGPSRYLPPRDLVRAGEYRGVPVFMARDEPGEPDHVYLPIRPGCEFQAYRYTDTLPGRR